MPDPEVGSIIDKLLPAAAGGPNTGAHMSTSTTGAGPSRGAESGQSRQSQLQTPTQIHPGTTFRPWAPPLPPVAGVAAGDNGAGTGPSQASSHPATPHHQPSTTSASTTNPQLHLSSPSAQNTPASASTPHNLFNPSETQTQAPGQSVKRSRQRPTKSCERCRSKKLKCDRELPCGNCKKGGRDGMDCEFRFGGAGEDEGSGAGGGERTKAKRARVEKGSMGGGGGSGGGGVAAMGANGRYAGYGNENEGGNGNGMTGVSVGGGGEGVRAWPMMASEGSVCVPAWGTMLGPIVAGNGVGKTNATPVGKIEVKGTRSRYVGSGDKMAMMEHFEQSRCFIMKSFKDSQISSMMQEMSTFQRHYSPRHKCKPEIHIPYQRDELMTEMLRALPSRFVLGSQQTRYISNWESVLRILHIQNFMRECDILQDARDSEPLTQLPDHIPMWIVPQVLAVLSIASRLSTPGERSVSGEYLPDENVAKNILMVQRWLDELFGKVTLELPILQTRALLLLARQTNLTHPAELYRRSGDLVRIAMTMGLHKDAETCEQIPMWEKEMRRKLWFTIVEMDIHFALASGMPASVTSSSFDTRSLMNIDDQDLTAEMQNYPLAKEDNIWTDATAQIAVSASLRDRLNATNLLGGCLDLERDAPTLLTQAKLLEQALRSLPDQFRGSTRAGNDNNKRMNRLFASIMLDISLRRPLLALYRTVATSPQSARYPEARKGALRCSLAILSHLDALDPAIADLNTVKSRDYLNLFHLICKVDIMQSALITCYEIRSFNSSPTTTDANSSPEDSFPHTKHSLTRVVENTLNSILQRLGEFGSDLKDVLPLAVVLQSVRSDGSEEEVRESMVRGAERVVRACRKVMPSIEDAALLNSVARGNDITQQQQAPILPHLQNWQPGLGVPVAQPGQPYAGYGGPQTFGDFNVVPGAELNFADFDFGFGGLTDWDLNQYWM